MVDLSGRVSILKQHTFHLRAWGSVKMTPMLLLQGRNGPLQDPSLNATRASSPQRWLALALNIAWFRCRDNVVNAFPLKRRHFASKKRMSVNHDIVSLYISLSHSHIKGTIKRTCLLWVAEGASGGAEPLLFVGTRRCSAANNVPLVKIEGPVWYTIYDSIIICLLYFRGSSKPLYTPVKIRGEVSHPPCCKHKTVGLPNPLYKGSVFGNFGPYKKQRVLAPTPDSKVLCHFVRRQFS